MKPQTASAIATRFAGSAFTPSTSFSVPGISFNRSIQTKPRSYLVGKLLEEI